MAIFHFSAKIISRGKGQSAIAAAAYRSGQKLTDEQTGDTKHYRARSQRIIFEGVFAPKDAPAWAKDRNALWNAVEIRESQTTRPKQAQLAREIEIALPHELTDQQREWLVKDFVREQFTRKGFVADVSIHAPDRGSDERNHHAHIMVTLRQIGEGGFAATKDRDQNTKKQLQDWRQQWEQLANRHLERHGHAARIDRRSLKAQGIEREPQIHVGVAAKGMKARGVKPSSKIVIAPKIGGSQPRQIDYPVIDNGQTRAQANAAIISRNHGRQAQRELIQIEGASTQPMAPISSSAKLWIAASKAIAQRRPAREPQGHELER